METIDISYRLGDASIVAQDVNPSSQEFLRFAPQVFPVCGQAHVTLDKEGPEMFK